MLSSHSDTLRTKEMQSPIEKFEVISSSLLLEQYGGDRVRNSVDNLGIKEELELINVKYRSILSTQDERILFRPILAYKIKPKNILGVFQSKWRYLMFTNKRLYTFDPATYEAGNIIDQDRLIVNRIDIDFLSHMIFFPHFLFDGLEVFDVSKLRTEYSEMRRNALKEDLQQKKCQLILGFKQSLYGRFNFNESDIALETNMYVVLQIIHACQLVNLEEFAEFNKESLTDRKIGQRTRTTQLTSSNKNLKGSLSINIGQFQQYKSPKNGEQENRDEFSDDGKVDLISNKRISLMKKRSQQKLEKINYFPVFIVKNQKYNKNMDNGSLGRSNDRSTFQSPRGDNHSQNRFIRSLTRIGSAIQKVFSPGQATPIYKLKQFYRSKNSQAEYSLGQIPEVLKRVDTKYFCELFWALERESYPIFIQNQIQDIERFVLVEQEENKIQDYRSQEQESNDKKFFNSLKYKKQSEGDDSLSYPFQQISGTIPQPSETDNKSWRTTGLDKNKVVYNPSLLDNKELDGQKSALVIQDKKHQYYENNLLNKFQINSPRKTNNNLDLTNKRGYIAPSFMLEEIRGFKLHIIPTPQLKKEFEHQKYKLYKPFILQNHVQLEFRSGDYIYLAIRISKVLSNAKDQSVQNLIYQKAKVFDEDLVDVFPNNSQPKVLLREFVGQDSKDEQVQYRMYFGFLIPKFRKTLPVDSNNLSIIGFKHGLMLLYQFIQFMVNIHKKEHNFGYLDFSNIYFAENKDAQKTLAKRKLTQNRKQSNGLENQRGQMSQQDGQSANDSNKHKSDSKVKNESQTLLFTVDLIFIDKSLQNLAIEENNELLNQGYLNGCISQTTIVEQKLYQQNYIDQDFFELSSFTQSIEVQTAGERSKSPPHSIVPVNPMHEIRSEMIKNQQKIDQILKNIIVSPNFTEIESLKIFVDTILQYCHRIQKNQQNNKEQSKKREESSRSKQKQGSITKNEQVKDQEESYEFLRKKDDQMRLNFLLDFLQIFNTHLVQDITLGAVSPRNQDKKKQNQRNQSLQSHVSLGSEKPQSIRNFESKIFENQLSDAMNLCQKYIEIYEEKEFWQNSLAQYIEDIAHFNQSQLQSNIFQASSFHQQSLAMPEGKRSPLDIYARDNIQIKNQKINQYNKRQGLQKQQSDDNQVANQNHSFISFTNYSASQPGADNPAMSQANPNFQGQSLVKKNLESNSKQSISIIKKKILGKEIVKAHENILEDMLNMTQNFDNLYSENGQTDRSSTVKSLSSQIEALEKGKFKAESPTVKKNYQEAKNKNMTDYKSRQEQQQYPLNFKRRLEIQEKADYNLAQQKIDKNLKLGDLIEDDEMYFEQKQDDDEDISNRKGNQFSQGRSNNTVRVKQREKKIQMPQQFQQVSSREGIESIVSGSGTQGEKGDMSYVNFMMKTGQKGNFTKFGTISGIGIGAQQYRENQKSQAQRKVEEANAKFRQIQEQKNKLNLQQNIPQQNLQKMPEPNQNKRGGHTSQQKYARESVVNEIRTKIKDEELPESEDDEEENEKVYELPSSPRQKGNQQKKGHVNLIPQIDRKSRISTDSNNNQSNITSQLSNPRQDSPSDPRSSKLSKERQQQSQISKSSKGSLRVTSPRNTDRNPTQKLQSVHQGKIGELQRRTSSKLSKEKSKVSQGSSQFSDDLRPKAKINDMLMIKHLHDHLDSKQSTPQFNEPYQDQKNYRK